MSLWDWIYSTFGLDHLIQLINMLREYFGI